MAKLLPSDDALFVLTEMQHEHSNNGSYIWVLQCQEKNINYIIVYTNETFQFQKSRRTGKGRVNCTSIFHFRTNTIL